jgi:hypothetical protein
LDKRPAGSAALLVWILLSSENECESGRLGRPCVAKGILSSRRDNDVTKHKRPNVRVRPLAISNRDVLNGAHMPFFFFFGPFFFGVAMTYSSSLMRPYPSKRWRITNERRMNQLRQQYRGCRKSWKAASHRKSWKAATPASVTGWP